MANINSHNPAQATKTKTMKMYMLTVYGTPGKFDGYSQCFKSSKKAGKAFARTIAAKTESALTLYIGNNAEWEITNY